VSDSQVTINIVRYDPEIEDSRSVCSYQVPDRPGGTVLEALHYIWANQEPDLAFRYGCRVKQCGACVVSVNGKVCLACATPVEDGMFIEPASDQKLIKDLVTDIS